MTTSSILFSPLNLHNLTLKNRITMAPLYSGYADSDGRVTSLMLDHYKEMAASGVSMVVVENAGIDFTGLGSPFSLRVDDDKYIQGLSKLAKTIQQEGALAFLQINHAGKYTYTNEVLVPSPENERDSTFKEMTIEQIDFVVNAFKKAAIRVKEAGFDGVEIHGGTGYLIVQFMSPLTNHRKDIYGETLENRMRFPLQVVDAVISGVGKDYPVGYRFLADEELPDGLHTDETSVLAKRLEQKGVAYLSVMAGTYESFILPEYIEKEKKEAYMTHYASIIKKAAPNTPIITAGRIQTPKTASDILEQGKADLIGLARVLLSDPLWPKKAAGINSEPIVSCKPNCSFCMIRTIEGKPVFCIRWSKDRRKAFLKRIGEEK